MRGLFLRRLNSMLYFILLNKRINGVTECLLIFHFRQKKISDICHDEVPEETRKRPSHDMKW